MNIFYSILIFTSILTLTSSEEAPRHQDVDHIEEIEVEQTQVIITTTKQGPVEHLKIHIELVDIEANKRVNPVDLSGLWLTITRGRYTIPFLRPDTWYGVRFRSENQINGRTVVHEDERLIKTKPREEPESLAASIMGTMGTMVPPMVLPGLPAFPPVLGVQNEYSGQGHGPNIGPNSPYPTAPSHWTSGPNLGLQGQNLGLQGPNFGSQNQNLGFQGSNLGHQGPNNFGPQNQNLGHSGPNLGSQGHPGPNFGRPQDQNLGHPGPNSGLQGQNRGPESPKPTKSPENHQAIDVKMHRSLDGVENFESLYVTVEWKDTPEHRSNLTTGVVKLRVICDNSETKEEIKLKGDEDSITIEITMDQKYDIEEMDAEKHQIKAHITPLKCHKICWTTDLVLSSGFGDFTKHLGSECKEISGTTSTTFLRNIKNVAIIENNLSENELIVETEVVESEYGVVTLLLQKLGGNQTEEPIKKSFDTTTSNGRFVVPVEDDAIYAVIYNYVKTKPFHYTSKANFLVESPAVNSTKPSNSLVDLSVIPTSFNYKHDKKETVLKPEPPFLLISRSPYYSQNDLLVKIEPFCNESEVKFRLEDRYPQHQIDAVPFLCGLNPKMYFCDKNVTNWQKCDSTLCFSTSVLIGLDSFEADSRCLNVTQHFPPLISHSTRTFAVCVSLFFILSRFSFFL